METLDDKLKSLGVKKGINIAARPETSPAPAPDRGGFDISQVVAGHDLETAFGITFVVEEDFPLASFSAHRHLFNPVDLGTLGHWAQINDLNSQAADSIVFLDTETSGLAGGTGTFVFLVGLAFRTPVGYRVVQVFMRDPSDEPAFLAGLAQFLAPFKTIVTFNGKSFDIPMLNTRHILNGFTPPFSQLAHIDLLPLARRLWRNRLPSRALKDLEQQILGITRTAEEVPGWLIPELYFDYLHSKDARPLKSVLYHNAQDILSLGLLFNYVADLLANPLQIAPEQGLDVIAIARLYEDLNRWEQAVVLYEHGLAQGLPLPFFLDTLRRFANLYRKQEQWDDAIRLWNKAAQEYHQVDACIELAKCHEHRRPDYSQALHWVELGLTYTLEIPAIAVRNELQKDLNHRAARLRRKATSAGKTANPHPQES
jgi:uncharacterized protein YprB with RNaseH-like and TPR domain